MGAHDVRLLVCGSRDYRDRKAMGRTLDALAGRERIEVVIEGEAPGADTLARQWARGLRLPVERYPADWDNTEPRAAAGPIRNRKMLAEGKPDLVVAFLTAGKKLSESKGTRDMVSIARRAGVRTIVVGIDDIGVVAGGGS